MSYYGERTSGCSVGLVVIMVLIALFFTYRGTQIPPERAIKALESQGFADVQIVDKAVFLVGLRGCDGRDAVKFVAMARNPRGEMVKVYVCGGLLKGMTVRYP